MAHKAPGKAARNGISLIQLFKMFPDNEAARAWFESVRWGGRPFCPHCGSENVQHGVKSGSMTHRCREKECAKKFSVRVGTVMESSRIPLQKWAIAIYLMTTSLKSVSSMKLHRDLSISQKSAWFLAHRIREWMDAGDKSSLPLNGPIEVDETYVGGERKNMPKVKRSELTGRGPAGKTAVAGIKDRETKQVRAKVAEQVDSRTLIPFVEENAEVGAKVYTDDAHAYKALPTPLNQISHESVQHSMLEYVRGDVHTNGIESFWSMLKRAHKGRFHKLSPKHLNRYVQEFAAKHNIRELDTLAQMEIVAKGFEGKRLTYDRLIAE